MMRFGIAALFVLLSACAVQDDDVSAAEIRDAEATAEAVLDDVAPGTVAETLAECVADEATEAEIRTLADLNDTDPALAAEQRVTDVLERGAIADCTDAPTASER